MSRLQGILFCKTSLQSARYQCSNNTENNAEELNVQIAGKPGSERSRNNCLGDGSDGAQAQSDKHQNQRLLLGGGVVLRLLQFNALVLITLEHEIIEYSNYVRIMEVVKTIYFSPKTLLNEIALF